MDIVYPGQSLCRHFYREMSTACTIILSLSKDCLMLVANINRTDGHHQTIQQEYNGLPTPTLVLYPTSEIWRNNYIDFG